MAVSKATTKVSYPEHQICQPCEIHQKPFSLNPSESVEYGPICYNSEEQHRYLYPLMQRFFIGNTSFPDIRIFKRGFLHNFRCWVQRSALAVPKDFSRLEHYLS